MSIQLSIQSLNTTAFSKHKIFIYPESAFNIGIFTPFLFDGKVRRVVSGIDEMIDEVEIEFPSHPFGTHIQWVTPLSIVVDNAYNTIFKGFITDEDAILSRSSDQITAIACGYKWMLRKLSKIRGKIYTVDNYITPKPGFLFTNTRVFTNESKFEKFRYTVPGGQDNGDRSPTFQYNEATGFLGGVPTIFNENGDPDCAANDFNSCHAVCFKYEPDDFFYYNLRYHERRGNVRFFWNYATILKYIANYYIENVFAGFFGSTRVSVDMTGLIKILRFGQEYGEKLIIPDHFEITGLSPAEAFDKTVKSIPGSWSWRVMYFSNSVKIEVLNNYESLGLTPGRDKTLIIGTGGKINSMVGDNPVNVAELRARRSIRDAISHAVAVGAPIQIETSIQYIPGWTRYLRPLTDFDEDGDPYSLDFSVYDGGTIPGGYYISDFSSASDYDLWSQYISGAYKVDSGTTRRLKEVITSVDELRYSQIYRLFVFPQNKIDYTRFPNINISSLLPNTYNGYVTYLHELIFSHVIVPRKIMNPITNYRRDALTLRQSNITDSLSGANRSMQREGDNPIFVFLYDSMLSSTIYAEGSGGAGVPSALQWELLQSKSWLVPGVDDEGGDERNSLAYSLDSDNRVILFNYPQYCRNTVSAKQIDKSGIPSFAYSYEDRIQSRKIFATARIDCDVPLIKDKIANRDFYGNARLVSQDIIDKAKAIIRVNAFFPTPVDYIGDSLTFTPDSGYETGNITRYAGASLIVGAKLADWNRIDKGIATSTSADLVDATLVVDNSNMLEQVIEIMLGQVPLFTEEFEVDLGRLDTVYNVGDRVTRIINSELSDGTGGYFNMKAVILEREFVSLNDGDSFTTRLRLRNNIPPVLPKMAERRI